MVLVEAPQREAFFASRAGVCVYVIVRRHAIRVCFESADASGRIDDQTITEDAAAAIAAAWGVLHANRESLMQLFDRIAEASGPSTSYLTPDGQCSAARDRSAPSSATASGEHGANAFDMDL